VSGLLIRTCAKVNLCLRVLGKRPDGYHEVETVMHAISLWDCLALRPAPEGARRLRVRGEAPEDGSNTCLRAAELMAEAAGRGDGLGIELPPARDWGEGAATRRPPWPGWRGCGRRTFPRRGWRRWRRESERMFPSSCAGGAVWRGAGGRS